MHTFRLAATALLLASSFSFAQDKPKDEKPLSPKEQEAMFMKKIESFGWTRTGKGRLQWAEIEIPPGYRFTGKSGAKQMLEINRNIPQGNELGVFAPEGLDWWVVFDFDETGYVKDTDKNELDPDGLLKSMKEGQEAQNESRAEQGFTKLFIDGWAMPPRYNEVTHNLEWAIKLRNEKGGTTINYLTKLLGRKGVMNVTLLVDPEHLQTVLPEYQKVLKGFSYTEGQSYAEYRQGDKVAQYTLAGLVTAGAGVALLKSGWLAKLGILFAKLGKGIIVVVVAVGAALKKVFMKLFGKSES